MDKENDQKRVRENLVGDVIESLRSAEASFRAEGRLKSKDSPFGETERAMSFEEFSKQVLRFESVVSTPRQHVPVALLIESLYLFSLAADLLDMLKKAMFYAKPISPSQVTGIEYATRVVARNIADMTRVGFDTLVPLQHPNLLGNPDPTMNMRALRALLGYCTEAGEVGRALRIALRKDEPVDSVNVDEEFGDGDWYKALWFDVTGQSHGATLRKVSNKLTARYGATYNDQGALKRNETMERAALEKFVSAPDASVTGVPPTPPDGDLTTPDPHGDR